MTVLYSSKGLTYVVYARSNIDISRDVKLRTITLTRWWAVAVILAM